MGRWARPVVALAAAAMMGAMWPGVAGAAPPHGTMKEGPVQPASDLHSAAFADPGVLPYGDAKGFGAPTKTGVTSPVVGMAPTTTGAGYWLVEANGTVLPFGDAPSYGSAAGYRLYAPIVGMAVTPTGKGYWLVALDGGIFAFGDARYYGSTGAVKLAQPIVGMAASPTGKGYWLVASDGGIFAFGDTHFYGSTGRIKLAEPIVGMAASPTGKGYWLVASDGGIFSFGSVHFYGSLGRVDIADWITGIAATSDGLGYWLANANGDVYHFGSARYYGDNLGATRTEPVTAIAGMPDDHGYWLLEPDAFPTSFSHPGGGYRNIVSVATNQVRADPVAGYFCNPYGPCEAWCALFATWVWRQVGVPIPSIPFVGNVEGWVATYTRLLPGTARPAPGDFIFYGSGPQNTVTAPHIGLVAQVWPDGAVATVEGDAGPGPTGGYNVIINGPFLPSNSAVYNGFPVFGYGVP